MNNNQQLLSVKETAELLGVSPSTVRKWANLSEIETVFDKSTGNRMFNKQVVLKFKSKLQNESEDLSLVGFGVDKLNKFSNSYNGKLFKYIFVILFTLLTAIGIYSIITLQSELRILKQSSGGNYRVVDVLPTAPDNMSRVFLQQEVIDQESIINASNVAPKSYGQIILNIDDNVLGILGKSVVGQDPANLEGLEVKNILDQVVFPEFFIQSSSQVVDKSTMRDTITGKIYCVLVSNGKLITLHGYCSN